MGRKEIIKMKALSIQEPYASEILRGEKTIEYRSWNTKYRGDLLICASANPKAGFYGRAVCIVNLYDVKIYFGEDYNWYLKDVREVEHFPVKGKLGFFNVDVPESAIRK
jgi:hypothetical protein